METPSSAEVSVGIVQKRDYEEATEALAKALDRSLNRSWLRRPKPDVSVVGVLLSHHIKCWKLPECGQLPETYEADSLYVTLSGELYAGKVIHGYLALSRLHISEFPSEEANILIRAMQTLRQSL